VPTSVLFDALLSKFVSCRSLGVDTTAILDQLTSLLSKHPELLIRVIAARSVLADDAMWLKLMAAMKWACLWNISKQSVKSIRDCVTPLILDELTDPELLLDALTAVSHLILFDGDDSVVPKQRSLLNMPGIVPHLIRLLHHSYTGIQAAALEVLRRSLQLIAGLMRTCLRGRLINMENFGHFCIDPLVANTGYELESIVRQITFESRMRSSYADILPLLVRMLRVAQLHESHFDCLNLIARCLAEVGRPAEMMLLQHDPIPLLFELIFGSPCEFGICGFHRDLAILDILEAIMQGHANVQTDNGVRLHTWMAQLMDNECALAGLECTRHNHASRDENDCAVDPI
jgi:hypothetical protein